MLPWKNWWFIGHFRSSSKPWSCLFPYKPVSSPFRLTLSFGSQRERLPSPKKTTRVTNIPITHFEQVSFRHEVFPWVIAKMNMFMVPDILSQWILETFFFSSNSSTARTVLFSLYSELQRGSRLYITHTDKPKRLKSISFLTKHYLCVMRQNVQPRLKLIRSGDQKLKMFSQFKLQEQMQTEHVTLSAIFLTWHLPLQASFQ